MLQHAEPRFNCSGFYASWSREQMLMAADGGGADSETQTSDLKILKALRLFRCVTLLSVSALPGGGGTAAGAEAAAAATVPCSSCPCLPHLSSLISADRDIQG